MRTILLTLLCLAPAPAGRAASISGVILPPGKARAVCAFERLGATATHINNRVYEGTIDRETGEFEIPNLPDGTYQLLIDCGDLTIEGVDLRIDDEEDGATFDYVFKTTQLATERLDLSGFFDPDEDVSPEREQEAAAKAMGVPKLLEKLESLGQIDRFCDHVRPLVAHGTKEQALVLVEKARLRDFYAGAGQIVYRVEVWLFRREGAVWDKPRKGVRVLQRHRFPDREAFLRLGAMFEPELGGIQVLNGASVTDIRYTIPDEWDHAQGKVPGKPVPAEPKDAEEPGEQ